MKTEHYPSLELCKKLTEAGFPKTQRCIPRPGGIIKEYFTPSIAELFDELPKRIHIKNGGQYYYCSIDDCEYQQRDDIDFENLPDALSIMWLWIKENKNGYY